MDTFRLAPTPAHFTDAEISGLFRMLEDDAADRFGAHESTAHDDDFEAELVPCTR